MRRPVIFQIAEDSTKKAASEGLNKQWKAVEEPLRPAVAEQANAAEVEPLAVVDDDDDGTAPF